MYSYDKKQFSKNVLVRTTFSALSTNKPVNNRAKTMMKSQRDLIQTEYKKV